MRSALLTTSPWRLAALAAAALAASACGQSRSVAATASPLCERCHGGNGSAAPPRSAHGQTATTDRGVGAHQQHLRGGDLRAAIPCASCHDVPTTTAHVDGVATVRFRSPAGEAWPSARWNPDAGRCENVYCHGATLRDGTRGAATEPEWTRVDGSQRQCDSCHAAPPASHAAYPGASGGPTACHGCHSQTVKADGTIDLAGGTHIDGVLQVPSLTQCDACHGAPPDTGAHRAHANPSDPGAIAYGGLTVLEDVAPGGGPVYDFGCGYCHPTDEGKHRNGTVELDLAPPATADPRRIKARNDAQAAYVAPSDAPLAGTCSGVYCHSSGQEAPTYAATPAWNAPVGTLGCASCHGNPPQYPNGGAGAADANSHVNLVSEFGAPYTEFGHYGSLPGAVHNPKHGGGDVGTWGQNMHASPITCQACHAETVDPAKVRGATGFFYFDPDGDYDLSPAGNADRLTSSWWKATQCSTCHAGELGSGGRVRPLRHVNGTRDVTFDRRPALPDGYSTGLPAFTTGAPLRPFYVTSNTDTTFTLTTADCRAAPSTPSCGVAADVAIRATVLPPASPGAPPTPGPTVITLTLEHAQYDPGTKTCSAVACHFDRQLQVEANAKPSLQWGGPYTMLDAATCTGCHIQ